MLKNGKSEEAAKSLHFTELQANAILDLKLAKLIGLEILALKKEHQDTLSKIRSYRKILSSRSEMERVIREELTEIKNAYAYPRRTVIMDAEAPVFEEKQEQEIPVALSMNRFGYLKMYDLAVYEKNKDAIGEESKNLIFCLSSSRICLFTDTGNFHQFRMKDVPLCRMKDKGVPLDNISNYDSAHETILMMAAMEELKEKNLLFVTARAMIKLVEASEFDTVKKTVAATKLLEGDRLVSVKELTGTDCVLVSRNRMLLRFKNQEISLYKKTSVGVRGMRLADDDEVEAVYDFDPKVKYLVKVGAKRVNLSEVKLKKRDGKPEPVK